LIGKGCRGLKRRKSAVVPTKSILKAANVPIIGGHYVLALQGSPEGWQTTSLLERCREHADRQGRVVQRHVLYLGEINDTQELAWRRSIEVLEDSPCVQLLQAILTKIRQEPVRERLPPLRRRSPRSENRERLNPQL
jgi:hypothetical protein